MVKLFMVRHGRTDWNEQGLAQGWTDIPLNKVGVEEAKLLAENLALNFDSTKIDVCLCSTLKRAKQTAQILVKNEKIKYDEMLKERRFGSFEGKKIIFDDIKLLWDYKLNYSENGVESLRECLQRAAKVLKQIKKNYDGKTVLLVTHGAFMKALQYNIEGYNEHTDFLDRLPKNTTVYKYELN